MFTPLVREYYGLPDPVNAISRGLNYISTTPLGPSPANRNALKSHGMTTPKAAGFQPQEQYNVPSYSQMNQEQQNEQNFVGDMINQQRTAMMANVPRQTIPALETDDDRMKFLLQKEGGRWTPEENKMYYEMFDRKQAAQEKERLGIQKQQELEKYYSSILNEERKRSQQAFEQQLSADKMRQSLLQTVNSPWQSDDNRMRAIQTLQLMGNPVQRQDFAGNAKHAIALPDIGLTEARRQKEMAELGFMPEKQRMDILLTKGRLGNLRADEAATLLRGEAAMYAAKNKNIPKIGAPAALDANAQIARLYEMKKNSVDDQERRNIDAQIAMMERRFGYMPKGQFALPYGESTYAAY